MTLPDAYRINLPHFEGPFDLLLFFIERDELDIRDIPIAQITDDYLAYVRAAEQLDIALAGEFLVVAATLMSIKARSLLPRLEVAEAGEVVDPRGELVDRLLEYQRYKATVGDLRALEASRQERHARPPDPAQFAPVAAIAAEEATWESVTLYGLAKAFERVMARQREREAQPRHRVVTYPYTIRDQSAVILRVVGLRGHVSFDALFGPSANRVHALVTFLALLELLNAGRVGLRQGAGVNQFSVTPPVATSPTADSVAGDSHVRKAAESSSGKVPA